MSLRSVETRSTWQTSCVLRGCVGVGVIRHATTWHRLCVHRPLVSNVLPLSLLQWEIQTRSTLQSRCVFCGCVGFGVMRHSYHLAKILRSQATSSQVKRSASQRAHRGHAPNDVVGKSPCEVSESVIGRPKDTSSWTGSDSECLDAVCVAVLHNSTFIP